MVIPKQDLDATNNERDILRIFFDTITDMEPQDNTISDSKIVKTTQNNLKIALRGSANRCTCARVTWGGCCEWCQECGDEFIYLRNFFRQIRNAKKYNMTTTEVQEFIKNNKERMVDLMKKVAK